MRSTRRIIWQQHTGLFKPQQARYTTLSRLWTSDPPPLRTNGRGYGNRGHRNQIPRKDVSHIRTRQLPWAVTLLVTDDDKPKGHIFTSRSQSLVMLHLCLLPLWILLEPSKYSLKWTPHRAGTDPKVIQKVTDDPGPGRDDCVES